MIMNFFSNNVDYRLIKPFIKFLIEEDLYSYALAMINYDAVKEYGGFDTPSQFIRAMVEGTLNGRFIVNKNFHLIRKIYKNIQCYKLQSCLRTWCVESANLRWSFSEKKMAAKPYITQSSNEYIHGMAESIQYNPQNNVFEIKFFNGNEVVSREFKFSL